MQSLSNSNCPAAPRLRGLKLNFYGCNEEFSLYHWLHVRMLVDEADTAVLDEVLAQAADAVPKKPVSEVESPATYQHFARNVV